jgi:hypothetical protein
MADNGKSPKKSERARRGLDPDFLQTVVELTRNGNRQQRAEPPVPSDESPGAQLEKWRELTER